MNSRIILCKNIKMDREYSNVLDYSESQMLELCIQNKVIESNKFSFIRSNKTIQVQFNYGDCLKSNYIAFQNPDYSNKWFFAWIDDVIYKGNNNTELKYTIDSWSTWFNKLQKKSCYVIREHTNNDAIGANTTDENLAVENVICEEESIIDGLNDFYICVSSNWDPSLNDNKGDGFNDVIQYNKNIFGQVLFFFNLEEAGVYNLGHFLYIINKQGHIEDVHDIFIIPKKVVPSENLELKTVIYGLPEITAGFYKLRYDNFYIDDIVSEEISINKKISFSDYTPVNSKCFCYPYNYLFVTNNISSNNIYRYEDFDSEQCNFDLQLALSIGVSGRIVPKNYKKINKNIDESLTLAKYPTCSWSADSYTNWLTQNAINIGQNIIGIGASLFSGNVASAGIASINLIGEFHKAQLLPNITGGQTTGDVNFGSLNNNFKFCKMRIKTEFLKQIDDYFSKYGYKTNRIKEPNTSGRLNFNYIEIGKSEEIGYGEIPSVHMNNINNACRKGVTIWHNHNNLGNFSVNNNII